MFPYTVKYTESESDIQNNNLLYKIHQNAKILSKCWKMNFENITKNQILFYYMYKFHNSYFVIFVNFVILGFEDFYIYIYIYIYITRVGLLHV